MNYKLGGMVLLLIGLSLIAFQFTITGNVVSNDGNNLKSIFGISFILIGILLLTQRNKIETEDSRIEKIVKFKPCKKVDLARVKQEIERVKNLANNPQSNERRVYHFHQVPIAREIYFVADAKVLNKEANQSGRGNLRYLLDRKTNEYTGLAQEKDNGSYKKVL